MQVEVLFWQEMRMGKVLLKVSLNTRRMGGARAGHRWQQLITEVTMDITVWTAVHEGGWQFRCQEGQNTGRPLLWVYKSREHN